MNFFAIQSFIFTPTSTSSIIISIFFLLYWTSSYQSTFAFQTKSTGSIGSTLIGDLARLTHNGKPIHQEITQTALSFLNPAIIIKINQGHEISDFIWANQNNHAFHFDNCQFQPSTEHIDNLYDDILSDLNPTQPNVEGIAIKFGEILHTAQDFYAHSNWVELGRTDLVDEGNGKWTVLNPYDKVKGSNVVVIQGDTVPSGYTLHRDPSSKVVTVNENQRGLISGMAGDTKGCPSAIALGHYDPTPNDRQGISFIKSTMNRLMSPGDVGKGLNKDDESRPLFSNAKDLSIKQTTHEWCRLLNLVEQRYGEKGKQILIDSWALDKQKAQNTCQPVVKDNQGIGSFESNYVYGDSNHVKATFSFTSNNGIIKGNGTATYVTTTFNPLSIINCFSSDSCDTSKTNSGTFKFDLEGYYIKHNGQDFIRYKFTGVPPGTMFRYVFDKVDPDDGSKSSSWFTVKSTGNNTFESNYPVSSIYSEKTLIQASVNNDVCSFVPSFDVLGMINRGGLCVAGNSFLDAISAPMDK